jgi:hypothetical protein
MPSSVRSTCSSSTDRRRLSQSLNRVAVLGHLSGIDTAVLPPFRTDSPMTVMQDRLRELYGAPSIESLNSVDAVVTQVARPRATGTDDARTVVAPPPLTGPESGRRHGQQPFQRRNSLALSESAPSQRSTGSGRTATTSRSRARRETLSRQQAEQHQQHQPTVVSRPPLSHPELMTPGHARARSEAAVRMGSTARKRQSMAMKGGQGRQSLAVPQPDWVAQTLQGSRFASDGSSAVPRTAPQQQQPQAKSGTSSSARAERRSVGYRDSDSRRSSSAATVVPAMYAPAAVPTTMSIVQNARSRSRASQSVVLGEDGDDMQSVYSARSAATTSYAPRNFSRPMEKKKQQQQNIVRAQGVEFELLNHLRSSNSRTVTIESSSSRASSFRALSVVIPPSQSAASSFSVRSVTRSTTPPLPTTDMAPSPARTTSTSSRESTVFSDATCTRSSTVSSTTTVSSSRSPSPAPSSYDPVPDKTIIPARVAQVSESRQHPWTVESRDTKTLRDPRRSVMPPVTSASGLASSSHKAVAMVADDHHRDEKTLAAVRMNRTQPPTHPNPLAYHPIELAGASSRQQQEKQKHTIVKPKPYLLREEAANVVEQRRAESPPAFDNDNSLQRSDSLFLPGGSKGSASSPSSSSRMRNPPAQHEFFPSWTQHQQARSQFKTADGVGIQPYRKLEGLGPVPQQQQQQAAVVVVARAADDRRMLPSQSSSHRAAGVALPPHSSAYSLQRVAMTNAHQQVARVGGPVAAAATATRPMTSSRSLRKTTAIDFTRMRAEHGN